MNRTLLEAIHQLSRVSEILSGCQANRFVKREEGIAVHWRSITTFFRRSVRLTYDTLSRGDVQYLWKLLKVMNPGSRLLTERRQMRCVL